MNNSLRWKLILAFVLVFLAGAACGFFGALHVHHSFARMDSGAMAQHLKHRLRAELKLTPEQMQKISPIIDRAASELKTKREQTMRDVHEIFEHGRLRGEFEVADPEMGALLLFGGLRSVIRFGNRPRSRKLAEEIVHSVLYGATAVFD